VDNATLRMERYGAIFDPFINWQTDGNNAVASLVLTYLCQNCSLTLYDAMGNIIDILLQNRNMTISVITNTCLEQLEKKWSDDESALNCPWPAVGQILIYMLRVTEKHSSGVVARLMQIQELYGSFNVTDMRTCKNQASNFSLHVMKEYRESLSWIFKEQKPSFKCKLYSPLCNADSIDKNYTVRRLISKLVFFFRY
jgi:hypothetical protein